MVLQPLGLPVLKSTPDHRVYATADPSRPVTPMRAKDLSAGQYLAIPRRVGVRESRTIVAEALPGRDRAAIGGRVVEMPDRYLVPLRAVAVEAHDGDVYNMEVEEEHSYLAGFFAVSNCQNWVTSQALRDPRAVAPAEEITPAALVGLAQKHEARIITSTYNEPLITSEWAVAVFQEAKAAGLVCSYVSNGNGTPEVLDYIRPWVDLYKVDLKSFRDRHYRELGGMLERVLWTIRALHERGFWLEVVTLRDPGLQRLRRGAHGHRRFLVSVSPDVPWHVTAFHKDYKMTGPDNTGVAHAAARGGDRRARGAALRLRGQHPGRGRPLGEHLVPGLRRAARRAARVPRAAEPAARDGACPDCAARDSRLLGDVRPASV